MEQIAWYIARIMFNAVMSLVAMGLLLYAVMVLAHMRRWF